MPVLKEIDEEEGWTCSTVMRDLKYDQTTLMENALDSAHIPFTHHDTQGKRERAQEVNIKPKSMGKIGFNGLWLRPKDKITCQ